MNNLAIPTGKIMPPINQLEYLLSELAGAMGEADIAHAQIFKSGGDLLDTAIAVYVEMKPAED